MSDCKQHPMQCPQCGARGELTIWSSINTDITPNLVPKLVSGELFQWRCPNCHHSWQVVYPLLYHDMTKRKLIEFRPTPPDQAKDTTPNPLYAAFLRMGYTVQYVYSFEELSQKIQNINGQVSFNSSSSSLESIYNNDNVRPSISHSYVVDENGEPMLTYYRPSSGLFCSTPAEPGDTPYFLNIRRPIIIDVSNATKIDLPATLPSLCDGIILKNYGTHKITAFFVKDKNHQSMRLE